MCGISGYVGQKRPIAAVMDCLERLEYRGYDSGGVAYLQKNKIRVIRAVGKLENLARKLDLDAAASAVIGHTRWATHGQPSLINAHPQVDEHRIVAVVHNGIIDNFEHLKDNLKKGGVHFLSETDTEVIAQWIGLELSRAPAITGRVVCRTLGRLWQKIRGSFALAMVVRGIDGYIFFAKNSSPLIIGRAEHACYLASDAQALVGRCSEVYYVQDGEFGWINADRVSIFGRDGAKKAVGWVGLSVSVDQVKLCSFSSYLEKEIVEGAPAALQTVRSATQEIKKVLDLGLLQRISDIHIIACGTALHAGRVIKYLIEHELELSVDIDFASEFKYKSPLVGPQSLCFFISQSGETADTLGCVELCKELGALTVAITNVPHSRISQVADFCLFTRAGAEISVASTKAYIAQLALGYVLVLHLASILGKKIHYSTRDLINVLVRNRHPDFATQLAPYINLVSSQRSIFFIGRGLDYFVAMEGALKLKEVCYIHCEAMPAGELKHGSLALIDKNSIVIAVLTQDHLRDKMLNNIHELNARGARVILFSPYVELKGEVFGFVRLPAVPPILTPLVAIRPLQELTLHVANRKGIDPDKPKNLAKSVTVE